MKLQKIKDVDSFKRDEETQAILNTDQAALTAYKKKRNQLRKIDTMEDRINNLENKLDRIIELLDK